MGVLQFTSAGEESNALPVPFSTDITMTANW